MLILLSPAKTLDYETPLPEAAGQRFSAAGAKGTAPWYTAQAAELIDALRRCSAREIARLMHLSPELARLNVDRYQAWSRRATARNSRPALWAFDGDVYDGLQARTLSGDDIDWAQQHLLMLSGLYGLLRPLDRLQPYRLEMGTAFANARGPNLYAFWHDLVVNRLDRLQAAGTPPVILNLASQEYFKVCEPRREATRALKARVVECVFEDRQDDRWAVVGFFAKRARGMMARHAIEVRARTPDDLRGFRAGGYAYAAAASTADRWVFRRRVRPAQPADSGVGMLHAA